MNPNHLDLSYSLSSSSSSDSDDDVFEQILINSYNMQNQILAQWISNNNVMASLLTRVSTNSRESSSRRTVNQQRRRLISTASRDNIQPHRRRRSSSGEEDGDSEWSGAIDSDSPPPSSGSPENHQEEIKGQKMPESILDETIEMVTDTTHVQEKDPVQDGAGVRLVKRAPPGIVSDHVANEPLGPKKKPRIVPGDELDEKSNKSVATEWTEIVAAEGQKSLAKLEARGAVAGASKDQGRKMA